MAPRCSQTPQPILVAGLAVPCMYLCDPVSLGVGCVYVVGKEQESGDRRPGVEEQCLWVLGCCCVELLAIRGARQAGLGCHPTKDRETLV